MSVVIISNMFDSQLNEMVNRAKVVINIHHGEGVSQQEQPRIGWLLANGKCVLTETSSINYYGDLVTEFTTYEQLIDRALTLRSEYNRDREEDISSRFANLTVEQIMSTAQTYVQTLLVT